MSAAREDADIYLHPYICEGCFQDYPLTERQYEKAMDYRGRLLCETCLEKRLSKAKPTRVETPRTATRRRGGGNSDGLRTTSEPPRPRTT